VLASRSDTYWAKLRAGQLVERPPLPPAPTPAPTHDGVASAVAVVEPAPPEPEETFLPAIGELIGRVRAAGPLPVRVDLRRHHPALNAEIEYRRKASRPRDSWYGSRPYRNPRYAPDLSDDLKQRALLLADALARHMSAHGAAITAASRRGVTLGGSVFGVSFVVWIYEPLRRLKQANPKAGEYERGGYDHSGRLLLSMDVDYWGRGSWEDGSRKLEERLDEVYPAILREVDKELRPRDERAREAREEAERQRVWEEQEARRRDEAKRRRTLLREAARWRRVEAARAYVSAVERAAAERAGVSDFEFVTAAWTRWARAVLDEMDPMTPRVDATRMTAWHVDSWSAASALEGLRWTAPNAVTEGAESTMTCS
jgi:hypothetical protein